jgi:hypothetical protein
MAAAAKYQIFISSTYEDLREERDQVIKAVLEMGHIPVGMEMFSAADEEQWKIISRHIDESDYYVVLAAHRLGSLTPEGISYTRKEYEYARSSGIPCLGFIIDDGAKWPADRIDTDAHRRADLNAFKAVIREKPVSFWSAAEDLHGKVSIALSKAFTAQPREGWVRSSSLAGPEVTRELTRLSAENASLREQLSASQRAVAEEHREKQREVIKMLDNAKRSPSYRYRRQGEWLNDSEVTLYEVFQVLAPELIVERSINDLASTLAMQIRKDNDQRWDTVAHNQMKAMMADLMTLELVQPSTRKHPVSDDNEYWSLAPFGVELLKLVRRYTLRELPAAEEDGTVSKDTTPEESSGDGASDDVAPKAKRRAPAKKRPPTSKRGDHSSRKKGA